MPDPRRAVTIVRTRQLTPSVREFSLRAADARPLPLHEAGAHIDVHLATSQGPLIRHYSLVGGPQTLPGTFTIAVKREDHARGSAHLHDQMPVGSQLQISPPRNYFSLDRRDRHVLLVAGGIGITPIVAMAASLAGRGRRFEVAYSGKRAQDMPYLDTLLELTQGQAQVHCGDAAGGRRLDLHALLARQPEGTGVYVCGPTSMVAATHVAAAQLGWPAARVRSELFAPAPDGTETAFELVLRQSGRTLQVPAHTSILEAMTAAGLKPMHDCAMGECGLCPLPVVEADGPLQHRDRYLSDEEKADGQTICICVSRVRGSRLVLDA